jgi:hypothetical protein
MLHNSVPNPDLVCGMLRQAATPVLSADTQYAASVSGALCGAWDGTRGYQIHIQLWRGDVASCAFDEQIPITHDPVEQATRLANKITNHVMSIYLISSH